MARLIKVPLPVRLVRAIRLCLGRALYQRTQDNLDEEIHQLRVGVKRTRALLRLVRSGLPEAFFEMENLRLRDASRALSSARDRAVMGKLLRRELARLGHPPPEPAPPPRTTQSRTAAAVRRAYRQLERSVAALEDQPLPHDGAELLAQGLGHSRRRARRHFRAALGASGPDAFHEWRKWTKTLLFQLRLARDHLGLKTGRQLKRLSRLEETLGRYNDATTLLDHLGRPSGIRGVPPDLRPALTDALEQRCERLRARVLLLGTKLFTRGTKAWLRKLRLPQKPPPPPEPPPPPTDTETQSPE